MSAESKQPVEQVPSLGRVVHLMNGKTHLAAIITDPDDDGQQVLTVFPPAERPFTIVATYDAAMASGTWHWPEFVASVSRSEAKG